MSWWPYRGRCIGRVIHFLYYYCGMDVAEHATIGDGWVEYRGKQIAAYSWSSKLGDGDVPHFVFMGEEASLRHAAQIFKRAEAISDGCAWEVPEDGRKSVDPDAVYAMNNAACRSAQLRARIVHDAEPAFFTHRNSDGVRLYCEAAGWIYAWDSNIGDWLLWVEGPSEDAAKAASRRAV